MSTEGGIGPDAVEVRSVEAGEIAAFVNVFEAAWGFDSGDEQRRHTASVVARESPLGAYAGGEMAGTAMSFAMELTVPGQARLPMAGVSYVAVHPMRRRRGIMRSLMRCQLDDLRARAVPLAGLGASEAGIYGRFGYGPATWTSSWRLARGALCGRPADADQCSLELVDATVAQELFPAVHDAARRSQVGDVRTYPGMWANLIGTGGTCYVLCRERGGRATGYAIYRIQREGRYSAHGTVLVDHVIAGTDAAYRSLWAYLANLDLTDWVVASGRPEHEPLRWALADGRQLVVTAMHDHLWLRIVDLATSLSQRRYAVEGALVLDVTDGFCPWNEGRWLLEGGPDGGECRRDQGRRGTSLRMDASVLGSLFLGGASVPDLAKTGRIEGDLTSLRRAHQMFADPHPWCSTDF